MYVKRFTFFGHATDFWGHHGTTANIHFLYLPYSIIYKTFFFYFTENAAFLKAVISSHVHVPP